MAYITDGSAAGRLKELGNVPGDHEGLVRVIFPDGTSVYADSRELAVHFDGLAGRTTDGRSFFVHNSGAVMIDAPAAPSAPAGGVGFPPEQRDTPGLGWS